MLVLRRLAMVLVVAVPLASCTKDEAGDALPAVAVPSETTLASVGAVEIVDEDFYAVPDPLPPGEHGDLLRYQRIDHEVEGVDAFRIMYLSESLAGEPIAVTGTVLVPGGGAPEGGWPVIAHSHGTTGLADECAPSRNYPDAVGELLLLRGVADRYIVAATDYEGLGTPGLHPYLVGESEGRGTLDAALAAAQLPDVEASSTTFIAGYSQGGHGALWANQLASNWTPELDVLGAFAGAPPGELQVIATVASSGGLAGGFFMLIAAGHAAAVPDLDLADILTAEGVEALAVADEACVSDALRALAGGAHVRVDPNTIDPWRAAFEASNPGDIVAESPVLIVHSDTDEIVPAGLSVAIVNRQCEVGQVVERRSLPEGSHGEAAVPAYQQAFEWFDDLLAGEQPVSTCPAG